jgi:hypothetical protein
MEATNCAARDAIAALPSLHRDVIGRPITKKFAPAFMACAGVIVRI